MSYTCPVCNVGNLKPVKITYTRPWGARLVVIPDFAAWRCDSCSFTRYDVAALAQVRRLLGPDEEELVEPYRRRSPQTEGPGEVGPRRWMP
ncbi:MAG TPA: YgiT-type zinc finger protein [Anaerolineae bacterium]|nr:YgiT-type zinc finger protein [Anaerolineae bacterium]HQI83054.1 YgiT-type zinc finger protein [Anaerolineae bacterium]